jgi:predicted PurR-regulated permease PerM
MPSSELVVLTLRFADQFSGKLVVAAIQGFWRADFLVARLACPCFLGLCDGCRIRAPVLGAFVIWVPAAIVLLLQGLWIKALSLRAWGILTVHPIDNLLGPVLVGARLRVHTLLTFFSVLGGMAAFGASGIVLGLVTVAIVLALFEIRQESNSVCDSRHSAESIRVVTSGKNLSLRTYGNQNDNCLGGWSLVPRERTRARTRVRSTGGEWWS